MQCAKDLFAACSSFVCSALEFCSVREFCLQRVILLLVVCMYLFTVSFCLQCAGDDFFDVLFMFARHFFYLQCFLFLKAVSPVDHRFTPTRVVPRIIVK